jgi:hypothetical protein
VAVTNQQVVRAACDACGHVQYADAPAQPAGFHFTIAKVDGNGQVTEGVVYACQPGHVGAAAKKVLQATKPGTRLGQVAPVDKTPTGPVPGGDRPSLVRETKDQPVKAG